ncbi:exonuclease, subunit C [Gottschalkia acidurici 9a]|uniref:Nuclease SbcCD subunit C n=1 Tax=Gottschalkia acidurici (strain ATCC 7906 / DSM 604 / BCRC 14475 / CIP 104303 / KCTC 5404 / NCIMB 10678 / 9a) TaxID=1128398 RepID=K0B1W9_GOTA9|nr:SbcC/MukB-like Walker B domain-containing protein [Gottschalkia acidurici]AFS78910.1 exonuclease, subunit C [Gottschalkia acidurici 9a]
MKPINLKISGLNSFLQEEEIDFSKLVEKGLFGIFGPTGSGKSTILDAITLAIYGQVARKSTSYINTEVDKLYISFEFEAGNGDLRKKYKVERSIKRTKNGGISTVFAKLITYDNLGNQENIIEKTTDVKKEIEENVIGLNFDDFIKTVVLPQGKFSEFLTLTGSERNKMLERILGLEEYGDKLTKRINEKRDLAREKLNLMNGELSRYDGVSKENIEVLKQEQKQLLLEEEVLEKQIETLNKDYEKYKKIWELQQQLAVDETKYEKLVENQENINEKNLLLEKGINASSVVPYIYTLEEANRAAIENRELLKKYKEQLERLTIEVKEKEIEYKVIYEKKEKDIPLCRDKKNEVEEAIKLEEEKEKLESENRNLIVERKDIGSKIDELSIKLEKIIKDKKEIEEKICKDEKYISEKSISSTYRTKVTEGYRLEEKHIENEKNIKENQILKENVLNEIEKLYKDKKVLEEELNDKNSELKNIEDIRERLLKSKPDDDKTRFSLKENILEMNNKIKEYKETEIEIKNIENTKIELDKKINENSETLEIKKKELNSKEKALENITKLIEDLKYKNLASILSKELRENGECPVCGSTSHPRIADKVSNDEIEENEKIKLELEKSVASLKDDINKLEFMGSSLSKDSQNSEREIETLKEKISSTNSQELEKEKNMLEEKLQRSQDYLEKWNSETEEVNSKLQIITKEKHDMEKRNTILTANIENSVKKKNELEVHLEKLQTQYELILKSYEEIKEELKLENIKEKLDEITNTDKELEEITIVLNTRKEKLKVLEKEKSQIEEAINSLKDSLIKIEQSINSKEEIIKIHIEKIQKVSDGKNLKDLKEKIEKYVEHILKKESKLKLELEQLKSSLSSKEKEISGAEEKDLLLEKNIRDTSDKLEVALEENKFKSIEEVKENSIERSKLEVLKYEIENYEKELNLLKSNIEKINRQLEGRSISTEEWNSLISEKEEKINYNNELQKKKGQVGEKISELSKNLDRVNEIQSEIKKLQSKDDILQEMSNLVRGKDFIKYISKNHLKAISRTATSKLKKITRERYGLEIDEENNFIIVDNYNGGVKRECNSLSGGETFLVSLSLALALSTEIQLKGKVSLEFFFLDEGFGTLDTTTLDVAMSSLEKLHTEKLSVGIISHVEELKNRVPVKLLVSPPVSGICGSKVKIEWS